MRDISKIVRKGGFSNDLKFRKEQNAIQAQELARKAQIRAESQESSARVGGSGDEPDR